MKMTPVFLIFLACLWSSNAFSQAKKSSLKAVVDCQNTVNTAKEIEELILGEWKWEKSVTQSRLAGGKVVDKEEQEGVRIEFFPDHRGLLYDKEGSRNSFNWKIVKNEAQKTFKLKTDPAFYNSSKLIVCEEELIFSASAVDGPDNYFSRLTE